ncbi:MAG: ATP phosphoribosyltransferase regulatory subunit [Thermoanaerobaculia bacterium]
MGIELEFEERAIRSFPAGARALLPAEARSLRQLESRITGRLEAGGFEEVILPVVDYVDPYREFTDARALRQAYRFTDREGDLVAVRSDFTPMLARTLAPVLSQLALPLRLFYRGDVVRADALALGRTRESFQIGAELVGAGGAEIDAAVIALAVESVMDCGIRPEVVLGDASVLDAILAPVERELRREIATLIRSRRWAALERFRNAIEPATLDLLERAVRGELTLDALGSFQDGALAERLSNVVERLEKLEVGVAVDDLLDTSSYYTGIRFRLFAGGGRTLLGGGGRYDALYGMFGSDAPAVGFSLNLDALEACR